MNLVPAFTNRTGVEHHDIGGLALRRRAVPYAQPASRSESCAFDPAPDKCGPHRRAAVALMVRNDGRNHYRSRVRVRRPGLGRRPWSGTTSS